MLSQTTEYALRAVVCLAATPEQPKTSQQLADETLVPSGYMSKVLQELSRAGLIQSQRGLHGGSMLTRNPDGITILDVVNAIEPIRRIDACPLGLKSHVKLCPLHRRLDEAMGQVESAFSSTTISELMREKAESTPLCDSIKPTQVTVKKTKRSKSRS